VSHLNAVEIPYQHLAGPSHALQLSPPAAAEVWPVPAGKYSAGNKRQFEGQNGMLVKHAHTYVDLA
jgi:hypothetical protein